MINTTDLTNPRAFKMFTSASPITAVRYPLAPLDTFVRIITALSYLVVPITIGPPIGFTLFYEKEIGIQVYFALGPSLLAFLIPTAFKLRYYELTTDSILIKHLFHHQTFHISSITSIDINEKVMRKAYKVWAIQGLWGWIGRFRHNDLVPNRKKTVVIVS